MKKLPAIQEFQAQYFEDFPYPSSHLSAFLFSESTGDFVIALRQTDHIVRYSTSQTTEFIDWLRKGGVRDVMMELNI